jgi:cell division protein FtsB
MSNPFGRVAFLIAFLAVVTYSFITLRGPKGISGLMEKQRMIHELEARNGGLARENERKRERIQRLSDNPSEQELEIERRLKLVRPGEKVFIVGEPDKK